VLADGGSKIIGVISLKVGAAAVPAEACKKLLAAAHCSLLSSSDI
jgi:hypothetical protein